MVLCFSVRILNIAHQSVSGIVNFPLLCPALGAGEFRALLKVQVDIKPLSCRGQLQGFDKPRRRYVKRHLKQFDVLHKYAKNVLKIS